MTAHVAPDPPGELHVYPLPRPIGAGLGGGEDAFEFDLVHGLAFGPGRDFLEATVEGSLGLIGTGADPAGNPDRLLNRTGLRARP